ELHPTVGEEDFWSGEHLGLRTPDVWEAVLGMTPILESNPVVACLLLDVLLVDTAPVSMAPFFTVPSLFWSNIPKLSKAQSYSCHIEFEAIQQAEGEIVDGM
ncbi:hypothetical protein JOQ06_016929, partial [Pogonophryne albipinna]